MIAPRFLALLLLAPLAALWAQESEVAIQTPPQSKYTHWFLKPFHLEKRTVPPIRLANSPRLEQLLRGGNLYLSAQDVIALALENNLDIAIQRYGPFLSREVLMRAEAGGLLRSTDAPVLPGPSSVSTAGISTASSGLAGGAGIGSVGSVITGIGPNPPSLDPSVVIQLGASHNSTPLTNTQLNATTVLVSSNRFAYAQYSQSFITGTNILFDFVENRNHQNSSSPLFNPWVQGDLDFQVSQPLLQGFGLAVNNRYIKVARNNLKVTDLNLKQQVSTTIAAVLNLYWDLVSFDEAVRIKQQSLDAAQKLYDDNKKQVAIGAMAGIEVTRAGAALSTAKEALLIAQTNVSQQEIVLKNALNRNALTNLWLDDVHVIPLDHIEVPKTDEVRPVQDLVAEAMKNRTEIETANINLDSRKILLKGTRNNLLPTLQAFADFTNNGLAGPVNALYQNCCGAPNGYFLGGTGTFLGQVLGRDFPNYSAGISLNIPFRNRQAQADYVTDELQLRQTELGLQRATNQVRVDVKTNLINLQQARARYETAVATRQLSEESLDAEEKRFNYGVGSVALVIAAQQQLASDQDAELQSMANYTHAKIAFDDALGRTLEVNHVSMEEAKTGHVARESAIPANLPGGAK
ncbi:MAG TPA: TolC family protein [Bryobacteraceae bacterium]|jgi:outer membrane protein TolC|nr:TolC family protein [Bryobacteraceae bacterium]